MFPLLQNGDQVYVKKINFNNLDIDDILLVKINSNYVIHRLIYKSKKYVVSKGDNNYKSDGKIYPRQIIGRISKFKRNGRIFDLDSCYLYQSGMYLSEILKVKKKFEKEKINFLFLKGLPIHLYFEKSLPRRIYADCDILIDRKDWPMAKKIIEDFGYRSADNSLSKYHKKNKRRLNETLYLKKIKNFPIFFDIHFDAFTLISQLDKLNELYPQELIDKMTDKFLSEKQIIRIENEYYPILSPVNLIIFLCLHILSHNFKKIYRYEILHIVVKKYCPRSDFDQNEFIQNVKEFHLQNFIYPSLSLLKHYFNSPIKNAVFEALKPSLLTQKYINNKILTTNIFDGEDRLNAGIIRFINLFVLSPQPIYLKLMVVSKVDVLYTIYWVIKKKFNV